MLIGEFVIWFFSRLTCIYKGCFSFKVVVQTRALHLLLYVLFNCVDIFIWLSGICMRFYVILPSVLWHCWLGVRKSIRPVKIEWWGVGVVYLERGTEIVCIWSSWCHCRPKTSSSLASFKPRLVLPFWYRLTQVVLENGPLNGCNGSSSQNTISFLQKVLELCR